MQTLSKDEVCADAVPRRITVPFIPPATPEEIERRRRLFDEAMALREEIGPIGISTSDLIRQIRDGNDGF